MIWIVFLASLFYTIYIIALYPVIIHLLARIRPNPVQRAPFFPNISIILATHNGAHFLQEKLQSIFALDYPAERMEVIVVDDGSTDATANIAESYRERIRLIRIAKTGKAGAVNTGVQAARGEVLVLTDVRQQLASDSVRLLVENLADPKVAAASAELQIRAGGSLEEAHTGAYWKYEKWIRLNLSAIDSIFGATGSLYAIRRELAVTLPLDTLNDDMHMPLAAFLRGYRLVVDRRAKMYDYPTNLASEFGRKVRTLAGNYQILRRYPQLATPKNRLLLHYLSYKLGRLFLPFALIVCAGSSLLLGSWWTVISILIQICVYTLALADPKIPEGNPLKRLSSPLRSFFVMMIATACAVSIWFFPAERLWKTTRVSRNQTAPQEIA